MWMCFGRPAVGDVQSTDGTETMCSPRLEELSLDNRLAHPSSDHKEMMDLLRRVRSTCAYVPISHTAWAPTIL